jgi:hypothetical protein
MTFASLADQIGLEIPVMDSLITLGQILADDMPKNERRTIGTYSNADKARSNIHR